MDSASAYNSGESTVASAVSQWQAHSFLKLYFEVLAYNPATQLLHHPFLSGMHVCFSTWILWYQLTIQVTQLL